MNKRAIGQKIRGLRKERNLSQKALSHQSGVAYATIQDIESGEGNPTMETLSALSQTLAVEPLELLATNKALAVPDFSQAATFLSLFQSSARPIQLIVMALLHKDPARVKAIAPEYSKILRQLLTLPK